MHLVFLDGDLILLGKLFVIFFSTLFYVAHLEILSFLSLHERRIIFKDTTVRKNN